MSGHIAIQGAIRNRRVWVSQDVIEITHGRPGMILNFFRDPRLPKGENPSDRFTVEWDDGTESDHRRDEFIVPDKPS